MFMGRQVRVEIKMKKVESLSVKAQQRWCSLPTWWTHPRISLLLVYSLFHLLQLLELYPSCQGVSAPSSCHSLLPLHLPQCYSSLQFPSFLPYVDSPWLFTQEDCLFLSSLFLSLPSSLFPSFLSNTWSNLFFCMSDYSGSSQLYLFVCSWEEPGMGFGKPGFWFWLCFTSLQPWASHRESF